MTFLINQTGPPGGTGGGFTVNTGNQGGGFELPDYTDRPRSFNVSNDRANPGFWADYALSSQTEVTINQQFETPMSSQVRLRVTEAEAEYLLNTVLLEGQEFEFEDHIWKLSPGVSVINEYENKVIVGRTLILPFASIHSQNPWFRSHWDKKFYIFHLNKNLYGQSEPVIRASIVAFQLGLTYEGPDLEYPVPFNSPPGTPLTLREIIQRTVRTAGCFIDYSARGVRIRRWSGVDTWDYGGEKSFPSREQNDQGAAVAITYQRGLRYENAVINLAGSRLNFPNATEVTTVRYEGGPRNDEEWEIPGKVGTDGDWLPYDGDWTLSLPTPDNNPGAVQTRIVETRVNGEVVAEERQSYGWLGTSIDVYQKLVLPDDSTVVVENPVDPQTHYQIYRTESIVKEFNGTTGYWEITRNEISEIGRMEQEDANQKQALEARFDLNKLITEGGDEADIRQANALLDSYLFNKSFPLNKTTTPQLKAMPYPTAQQTVKQGGRDLKYVASALTEGEFILKQKHPGSTEDEDLGFIYAGLSESQKEITEITSAIPNNERYTITHQTTRSTGGALVDSRTQDSFREVIGRVPEAPKRIGLSYLSVDEGLIVNAVFRVNSGSDSDPLLTSSYWEAVPQEFNFENPEGEGRINGNSINVPVIAVENERDLAITLVTHLRIQNAKEYIRREREQIWDDRVRVGDRINELERVWRVMGINTRAFYSPNKGESKKYQTLILGVDVSDLKIQAVRA